MAGLGFKDFAVGEVLTAGDVDGYLMQQSVMRFATDAARGSALGTAVGTAVPLAEGMVAYLDNANSVQVYDGAGWKPVDGAGIGSKVVSVTKVNMFTTTSSTFVDVTGLAASITPTSATSKILVVAQISYGVSSAAAAVRMNLVRGSTNLLQSTGGSTRNSTLNGGEFATVFISLASVVFLDSPNTTSSTTYKFTMATTGGTARLNGRGDGTSDGSTSTITLIEVAA